MAGVRSVWACPCGVSANFATRTHCRGCGAEQVAALAGTKRKARAPKGSKPPIVLRSSAAAASGQDWPDWQPGGPPKRTKAAARAAAAASSKAGQAPPAYRPADYGRQDGSVLTAQRIEISRLKQTVSDLQREARQADDTSGETTLEFEDAVMVEPPVSAEAVQKMQRAYDSIVAACGADDEQAVACKARLDKLQAQRKERMPLPDRTRLAQRKVDKAKRAAASATAAEEEAARQFIAAKEVHEAAQAVCIRTTQQLDAALVELKVVVGEGTAALVDSLENTVLKQFVDQMPPELVARPDVVQAITDSKNAWATLEDIFRQASAGTALPSETLHAQAAESVRHAEQAEVAQVMHLEQLYQEEHELAFSRLYDLHVATYNTPAVAVVDPAVGAEGAVGPAAPGPTVAAFDDPEALKRLCCQANKEARESAAKRARGS
jgi:hypothetical protein